MPSSDRFGVRSFFVVLYDADRKELASYQVPVSIVAPFANRMAREVLKIPDWGSTLSEPWYLLE